MFNEGFVQLTIQMYVAHSRKKVGNAINNHMGKEFIKKKSFLILLLGLSDLNFCLSGFTKD